MRSLIFQRGLRDYGDNALNWLCRYCVTVRPLGAEAFIARLEAETGRPFKPAKRGPRPKAETADRVKCTVTVISGVPT
jgi:sulfite reductase beta subunit-like hemoprotein